MPTGGRPIRGRWAERFAQHRWAPVVCWALVAALAIQLLLHALGRPVAHRLLDLHVYELTVRAAWHGARLYGIHDRAFPPFTYPPFAALVLLPLGAVPEAVSQVVWSLLSLAACGLASWLVVRRLPRPTPATGPGLATRLAWPLATALVLASRPVQSNLRFGQISLFLTVAGLIDLLVLDGRPGQGVLTGLAGAIKLTPLVFIPYLWVIGRRRAALLAAASAAVATLAGMVVFPADSRAFWLHGVFAESSGLPVTTGGNQSIRAVLLRAGAQHTTLAALWIGLSLAAGLIGLRRAARIYRDGQPLLSVAVAGCVGLAVSPISWTHHQGWILLGAAGVFSVRPARNRSVVGLILVLIVAGFPSVGLLGPIGRWLAVNARTGLELAIACLLPWVRLAPPGGLDGATSRPGPHSLAERPGAGSPGPPPADRPRSAGSLPAPRYRPAGGPGG